MTLARAALAAAQVLRDRETRKRAFGMTVALVLLLMLPGLLLTGLVGRMLESLGGAEPPVPEPGPELLIRLEESGLSRDAQELVLLLWSLAPGPPDEAALEALLGALPEGREPEDGEVFGAAEQAFGLKLNAIERQAVLDLKDEMRETANQSESERKTRQ